MSGVEVTLLSFLKWEFGFARYTGARQGIIHCGKEKFHQQRPKFHFIKEEKAPTGSPSPFQILPKYFVDEIKFKQVLKHCMGCDNVKKQRKFLINLSWPHEKQSEELRKLCVSSK